MELSDALQSLAGGALLGLSAIILLLFNRPLVGASGIVGGLFASEPRDAAWRRSFVVGLLVGGAALVALWPEAFAMHVDRSYIAIALAGLLVGFGVSVQKRDARKGDSGRMPNSPLKGKLQGSSLVGSKRERR